MRLFSPCVFDDEQCPEARVDIDERSLPTPLLLSQERGTVDVVSLWLSALDIG